jgi:hypothetical protein
MDLFLIIDHFRDIPFYPKEHLFAIDGQMDPDGPDGQRVKSHFDL